MLLICDYFFRDISKLQILPTNIFYISMSFSYIYVMLRYNNKFCKVYYAVFCLFLPKKYQLAPHFTIVVRQNTTTGGESSDC